MPHSNIKPLTRSRAQSLRRETTRAEAMMWDMLRDFRPRGTRFRRETPIGPYIADFAWLSARIIIEADGDTHETGPGRVRDTRRDAYLKAQGFRVMRFDNSDVVGAPDHIYLLIEVAIADHLKEERSP